jgi:DNA-damage-inducible protein J
MVVQDFLNREAMCREAPPGRRRVIPVCEGDTFDAPRPYYLPVTSHPQENRGLFNFTHQLDMWFQRDYNLKPESTSWRVAMSTADTYVRARIDTATKERAAEALEAMGLSISDAIRLLMLRIADEQRLPFEVKVPSKSSRKALAEIAAGKVKTFATVDDLMADLNADD